jgi:hypothetical protein
VDEAKDARNTKENLDPISDDEEESQTESREADLNADMATQLTSDREHLNILQGSASEGEEVLETTRESGDDDDDDDDDEDEHPLPRDYSLKRSSGIVCRPSKHLSGYDVY